MHKMRLPLIASLLSILFLALLAVALNPPHHTTGKLTVSFLDVGQGDATLIESPTGTQVLIDGGRGSVVLRPLSHALGFFDRDIDILIATHPDADHIGGLVDVLKRYRVHTVVMTENVNDTPVFDAFTNAVAQEHATLIFALRGQTFDLGSGTSGSTTLTILFPDHDPSALESNASSIVSRLTYGASEYLFTGDSPQEIEEYLVEIGSTTVASDVLKVGHHGSRTSSAETFVTAVHPTYAIISAGKDNSYGHPHKEVTDLLTTKGIVQKNTADLGTIVSESDGYSIFFK